MSSSPSEPARTLYLLRSPLDAAVRELVEPLLADPGATTVSLAEADLDYDELLGLVFAADRVICWW
jgi:hypothetical protein